MLSTLTPVQGFQLPRIRTTVKGGPGAFWDVRFCPYFTSIENPVIFAIVSTYTLHICQATSDEDSGIVFLAKYTREEHLQDEVNTTNSCTWCFIDENEPLVAIAGESGQIQVLIATTGSVFATLTGHGVGTINDLETHPLYPWIIASASTDSSVRVWDLRRIHNKNESACVILCGHGSAHSEGLLTIGWHSKGRYLISGGFDHKVCVWTLPDLHPSSGFWSEISKEKRSRSFHDVRIIHYPHFVSSAIHSDYVDKAVFFGDLIISKASGKEDKIVLWGITGFNSDRTPPTADMAPKTSEHLETRNGFVRKPRASPDDDSLNSLDPRYEGLPLYERYLEFNNPFCPSFYTRFGLLRPTPAFPHVHTILTMGNNSSQIRHWDLDRLMAGQEGANGEGRPDGIATNISKKQIKQKKGVARVISKERTSSSVVTQSSTMETTSPTSSRASSFAFTPSDVNVREPSTEATSLTSEQPMQSVGERPAAHHRKYSLSNPYQRVKEHKMNDVSDFKSEKTYLTARAADWSACGRWCIVVGESNGQGVILVLDRT